MSGTTPTGMASPPPPLSYAYGQVVQFPAPPAATPAELENYLDSYAVACLTLVKQFAEVYPTDSNMPWGFTTNEHTPCVKCAPPPHLCGRTHAITSLRAPPPTVYETGTMHGFHLTK